MRRQNVNDLLAFLAVAKEKSFTKAAAQLGVSQSALSHTVRALEERLGVRLLTRTTRSVAPTEAGERLIRSVGPHFDQIDVGIAALSELREKPAGTIRITSGEHAAYAVLWPALADLLERYPDIHVEIVVDYGLTDIVADRYDAGVRLGEQVAAARQSGWQQSVNEDERRRVPVRLRRLVIAAGRSCGWFFSPGGMTACPAATYRSPDEALHEVPSDRYAAARPPGVVQHIDRLSLRRRIPASFEEEGGRADGAGRTPGRHLRGGGRADVEGRARASRRRDLRGDAAASSASSAPASGARWSAASAPGAPSMAKSRRSSSGSP